MTFTGTSGTLAHSAQLGLTVKAAPAPPAPPSRSHYVRTDAATPYFGWLNPHWIVYSPTTARFFVTDPAGNHVFVIDALTQKKIAALDVPGAYGIDDTPDHNTLFVGTQIGDVYVIDAVAMTVTHRYLAAQIGSTGFAAYSALVLADGRLALLGGQGGIPSVDGYSSYAIWSPTGNSIAIHPTGNTGVFTRTPDRSKLVVASIDSDATFCVVDVTTSASVCGTGPGFITRITISPDGNLMILPKYPGQAVVYNAHTLAQIATFNVAGETASGSGFAVSADSKVLFAPSSWIVYAYDLSTYQQIGWFPNVFVPPIVGGGAVGPIDMPNFQVMDPSGLLVGPIEEGIGFVDSTAMRTGTVGTQFSNGYLNPPSGPVTGGTSTKWPASLTGSLNSVYFGTQKATSSGAAAGYITATTPPGTAGPVDVYAFATDGGAQYIPEGFSYGPWVVQALPDAATVEGGGVGILYGYGFGPLGPSTAIPPDLQITVGGKAATILAYNPNAYGAFTSSPPVPLQAVAYTVPPGTLGTADIQVTDSSGTTTATGAMTHLPPLQLFSLAGSSLAQGVYDRYRDLYYFTDANKIQVFSKTQRTFLPPINIANAKRLWGIALSPDGSKLAVSDALATVIYLLDPSNPSSFRTFPAATNPFGIATNPGGVAVSDGGVIFYAGFAATGIGYEGYFKLDTSSGKTKVYNVATPGLGVQDAYLRTAISTDNTRVYFNSMGSVFNIDTATDTVFYATDDPGCCYGDYDLSLSSNQTRFAASEYLYDADLNAESYFGLNDREILNLAYVYGMKLSPDGTLLFQPSPNGIDVLDGRIGTLRTRISLPVSFSANYDALVADGRDNILVAITGQGDGVAVIDLTSLSEPAPLPYASAGSPSRPASAPLTRHRSWSRQANSEAGRLFGVSNTTTAPRTVLHITGTEPFAKW